MWVNLKSIDAFLEQEILHLVHRGGGGGASVRSIKNHFSPRDLWTRDDMAKSCPGLFDLSHQKRTSRIDRIVSNLIKANRVRADKRMISWYSGEEVFLVATDVLDKIVFALDNDAFGDDEHSD